MTRFFSDSGNKRGDQ